MFKCFCQTADHTRFEKYSKSLLGFRFDIQVIAPFMLKTGVKISPVQFFRIFCRQRDYSYKFGWKCPNYTQNLILTLFLVLINPRGAIKAKSYGDIFALKRTQNMLDNFLYRNQKREELWIMVKKNIWTKKFMKNWTGALW